MTLYQLPRLCGNLLKTKNYDETQESMKRLCIVLQVLMSQINGLMKPRQNVRIKGLCRELNLVPSKHKLDAGIKQSSFSSKTPWAVAGSFRRQPLQKCQQVNKKPVAARHYELVVHIRPRAYKISDVRAELTPSSFSLISTGHRRLFSAAEVWSLPLLSSQSRIHQVLPQSRLY